MTKMHSFTSRISMSRQMGAALALIGTLTGATAQAETVTVGIGTQNTTTNTVTGGIRLLGNLLMPWMAGSTHGEQK